MIRIPVRVFFLGDCNNWCVRLFIDRATLKKRKRKKSWGRKKNP